MGNENQCLGLAAALGCVPVVKRISLRAPWRILSPYLRWGLGLAHSAKGDPLLPPWPDLLIASGRASIPASLYVRAMSRKSGARPTLTVQIQNPVINPSYFDLVVVPMHDCLSGDHVLSTRGSLHRITAELLSHEGESFRKEIEHLPSPRIGVLVGGPSHAYQMTSAETVPLAAQLRALAQKTGGSLLVTPSRRTGSENLAALQEGLKGVPSYIWDMQGRNPYFGMLALADAFLVTCDSVNLASEACSTGKPVHIIELPGGTKKFRMFHQKLQEDGLTRPFKGDLEQWVYQPLNDMQVVVDRVKALLKQE